MSSDCQCVDCIYCDVAYECVGDTINTDKGVEARGYKALSGPTTSFNSHTDNTQKNKCYGAFGCFAIGDITTTKGVRCMGDSGCVNATISTISTTNIGGSTDCRAPDACKNAVIQFEQALVSQGEHGCQYSSLKASDSVNWTPNIGGTGYYSLYHANIDSNNAGLLMLQMSGNYAGFGAKLNCQASDTCIINCNGNGCYMFYINCLGVNNCIINTTSSNTILPITSMSDFDESGESLLYPEGISFYNDQQCETETNSNSIKYDNYQQHYQGSEIKIITNTDGPICCRGEASCEQVINIEIDVSNYNADKHMIICSGQESCLSSNIINRNGPIFCTGYNGCDKSNVIAPIDAIYCSAGSSCTHSPLISAINVYCSGGTSCYKSNITSSMVTDNVTNIYFVGAASGWKSNIFCEEGDSCNILCAAKDSCLQSIAYCDGNCVINCDENEYKCPIVISSNPTPAPTPAPTSYPTPSPTENPSPAPTNQPTPAPTEQPTSRPTDNPIPPGSPTKAPIQPTSTPSDNPTSTPSDNPSYSPSDNPSKTPTKNPSVHPTNDPSVPPTNNPSSAPTNEPTVLPTNNPTDIPTKNTFSPTLKPNIHLRISPTNTPTNEGSAKDGTTEFEEKKQNDDDPISFLEEYMLYLIIGAGVLICCIIIICIFIFNKKKKAKTYDTENNVQELVRVTSDTETANALVVAEINTTTMDGNTNKENNNNNDNNGGGNLLKIWLLSIEMNHYYDIFAKQGFDSNFSTLYELTETHLKELGINKMADRLLLIKHINDVKLHGVHHNNNMNDVDGPGKPDNNDNEYIINQDNSSDSSEANEMYINHNMVTNNNNNDVINEHDDSSDNSEGSEMYVHHIKQLPDDNNIVTNYKTSAGNTYLVGNV